jgi:glycosyltransferase involved in cell wall biosynthesis
MWYRGSGIGTYTFQLVHQLRAVNAADIFCLFWPEVPHRWEVPLAENYEHYSILGGERGAARHSPAAIGDVDMDIYHVPQNGIGLPASKKSRFVITLHDVIPYVIPQSVARGYLDLFSNQVPRAAESADAIITVSEHSRQDICRFLNVPAGKVFVTHLAAEEMYQPLNRAAAKEFIARHYGIVQDYVLYVGGIGPRKNIERAIEAFASARPHLSRETKLVIAGRTGAGSTQAELERLAVRCGIRGEVIFPGQLPVRSMPYLYNAASLFVYPSQYEGFGLPPLEAMACGIPTIASNSSSIPEVVADGALLADPHDHEQWCESIYSVLEDEELSRALSEQGLRRSRNFSWGKTARETWHVYSRLSS